jgi:hypothetical protein
MAVPFQLKAKVKQMVQTLSTSIEWQVVVTTYTSEGMHVLGVQNGMGALDAFDYAIHAQGYFRYAIQDMDPAVRSITIDVINPDDVAIETIEITRD